MYLVAECPKAEGWFRSMTASPIVQRNRDVAFETCGHERPPRRVCDVCKTAHYVFVACSNQCLWTHQRVAHEPALPVDTATRARRAQAARNREASGLWDLYARHREQLMTLIPAGPADRTLCVLGAGKCDDLDLPRLADGFAVIRLVDLDGEAMERARDRQPARVRNAIVLQGGVDLSGLLARLDEWGEAFPDDHTLFEASSSAADAVVDALGGPFDVTLSTCVLSQLMLPFQNAWAASADTWSRLTAATSAVHLAVLARITAPRGAASLVFDALSSNDRPMLTALVDHSSEQLQAAVDAELQSGAVGLAPDPISLLAQIGNSSIAAQQPSPCLSGPWLWNIGTALQLVYALSFRRR